MRSVVVGGQAGRGVCLGDAVFVGVPCRSYSGGIAELIATRLAVEVLAQNKCQMGADVAARTWGRRKVVVGAVRLIVMLTTTRESARLSIRVLLVK